MFLKHNNQLTFACTHFVWAIMKCKINYFAIYPITPFKGAAPISRSIEDFTIFWKRKSSKNATFSVALILDLGLPVGVHSNRPCPSIRLSVFKYLRDRLLVFLKLCMKLGVNKVKKVTRLKF